MTMLPLLLPQSATSRRCRSAPREQAAETNHVRRMSPGAPASATVQATARSKSNPRGSVVGTAAVSPGYIERLYALGVEKVSSVCADAGSNADMKSWLMEIL